MHRRVELLRRRVDKAVAQLDRDSRYRTWLNVGAGLTVAVSGAGLAIEPALLSSQALGTVFSAVGTALTAAFGLRMIGGTPGEGTGYQPNSFRYLRTARKRFNC